MKEREGEVRVRPGDGGNWRRRRNAGRSALMEMDVLDARFTSKTFIITGISHCTRSVIAVCYL